MMTILKMTATALAAGAFALGAQAAEPVGQILSYTRSNIDGSEPETIHVYRQSHTRIVVNKRVSPCTTSALVTAELDATGRQAARLTAGKLNRQGGQDAFGEIVHDAATGRVGLRITPPGAPPGTEIKASTVVEGQPWMLYDFDLADFSVSLQARQDHKADFSFGAALLWPGEDPSKLLRSLGRLDARFVGEETWRGRPAYRFEVGGPAFAEKGGVGGPLWLDKTAGFVLGAQWSLPNHQEYRDYSLTLDQTRTGDDATWTALMMEHWKGCPAK